MKLLVIVGGDVHETSLLKRIIAQNSFDRIIAADSGLNWAYRLGLVPDQMMGDFDSVVPEVLQHFQKIGVPSIVYPTRKDFTDSELALYSAMDQVKPGDEIWILGGIGSRMDHTLANIFLLYEPLKKGIKSYLLDGLNEIQMIQGPCEIKMDKRIEQQYLSILPFLGDAEGIDLEGVAYPLENFTLQTGKCIGVSNEIEAEQAVVRLEKGRLIVIRSTNDTM